ncbi:FliI/YscN family ATPase [Roseitranquillus sediminis]|uniref:FliI/YscN family ATPase n=1 Tax=Roseitranquillus sediminis TaxID=2809051 RepID=UPI001D0CA246|nr:FliI/YscN family ATPase [Roseitranquillus sediminis]MBM9596117.1 FliI/YscN family ATPase [Roseitranquillus sediminis]
MASGLEQLRATIAAQRIVRAVGRIGRVSGGQVGVTGLSDVAATGDLVEIRTIRGALVLGEILNMSPAETTVLPEGATDGLSIGDRVVHLGAGEIAPDDSWIGRVIDPFGQPIDNRPILPGVEPRSLRGAPLNPTERRTLGKRLATGLAVFDTLLPIVRGQRIGLFAGSGVGKSTLLAQLARGLEADVVVIAMVGERGREVREFVEHVLGPEGMARSVVVAATSDRSPLIRRRCAWTAATIAEHFRDQGRHVLFMADSITRFADAHREVALAAGESGSLRGYPPSTTQLITGLCERAGPGLEGQGDITAVLSVLVAGSDMEEPVADILRGVLDGHVVLDRDIAERGRFPAVDVLRSVSRSLPGAATEEENRLIALARRRMGAYDRASMMIQAGLYSAGSDPELDAAIKAWPKLDALVAKRDVRSVAESFAALKACLS